MGLYHSGAAPMTQEPFSLKNVFGLLESFQSDRMVPILRSPRLMEETQPCLRDHGCV